MPCFVRQALDVGRIVSDDPAVHQDLVRRMMRLAADSDLLRSPPQLAGEFHRMVREITGQADPYAHHKQQANELALGLMDDLVDKVRTADDPLAAAARLAMAGNIIDHGVASEVREVDVLAAIDGALHAPLDEAALAELARKAGDARDVLYLCDNAGEIVLDRLLVEQIGPAKTTCVVRGRPVLNDATLDDARQAGLTELASVVANGSDAPGTVLSDWPAELADRFGQVDLVISKGQGNYETLSDPPRPVTFLLTVKCAVVAGQLGMERGQLAVLHR
jgi:hypothetical protein